MKYLKQNYPSMVALSILCSLLTGTPFAHAQGDKTGGGGDASEIRVNEIRSDLLKWVNDGGAQGLNFPRSLVQTQYEVQMKQFLAEKHVVISFTANQNEVMVSGKEKTCKGFISLNDRLPNILCHIERFRTSSSAEQYRLVHHEYAGLAGIETNEGGASDYVISDQLTDFLVPAVVLKLAVKRNHHRNASDPSDIADIQLYIKGQKRCFDDFRLEAATQFANSLGLTVQRNKTLFSLSNGKSLGVFYGVTDPGVPGVIYAGNAGPASLDFRYGEGTVVKSYVKNQIDRSVYYTPVYTQEINPEVYFTPVKVPVIKWKTRVDTLAPDTLGQVKRITVHSHFEVDETRVLPRAILVNIYTQVPSVISISVDTYTSCLKSLPLQVAQEMVKRTQTKQFCESATSRKDKKWCEAHASEWK